MVDTGAIERGLAGLPEDFSGVVGLAHEGAMLAGWARGHALKAEAIRNTPDTRFQLASGSKLFTSIAVCRLIDAGRLALDTPLRECVKEPLGGLDQRITIRHLLTHTSGITSYFEEDVDDDYAALWTDVPVYRMRRPADFLPLFVDKPMKFPPGGRFDYNDAGYVLLGLVVEAVGGAPFAEYVTAQVLAPAGMADSGYFAADRLPARTARAYLRDPDGGWRTNVFAVPVVGGGDGGAYATAPDLARLWHALSSRALLSDELTETLLRADTVTGMPPPNRRYGLGVWADDVAGYHFVEGWDPGVCMISGYVAASGLSLTVLANTNVRLWPTFRSLAEVVASGG